MASNPFDPLQDFTGIKDKPTNEKLAQMYETKSETDGYKALKICLLKANLRCSTLF